MSGRVYEDYAVASDPDTDDTNATLVGFMVTLLIGVVAVGGETASMRMNAALYLLGGICSLLLTAYIGAKVDEKTTFFREIVYTFTCPGHSNFLWLVAWPLLFPVVLICCLCGRSWREQSKIERFHYLMRKSSTIHNDTASDLAEKGVATIGKEADELQLATARTARAVGETSAAAARTAVITATLTSLAGALNPASASEKSPKKNKTSSVHLQADARLGTMVSGDGPDPQDFLRLTLSGDAGVVESINVHHRDFRAHELVAGPTVFKKSGVTVNMVGGGSMNSLGNHSLIAGAQIFVAKPNFSISTPVLRLERQRTPTATTTLAWRTEAFRRLTERMWLGGEAGIRHTVHKSTQWDGGPAMRWKPTPKTALEMGFLWNQSNQGVLRARLIHTF